MRVVEVDGRTAWKIISSIMGRGHGFWALEASRTPRGHSLVAYVDGVPAGATVYYTIDSPPVRVAVIYYVAVAPWARGRGLGKILVASAEELASRGWRGPVVYTATIAWRNAASVRMFESLGYRVVPFEEVASEDYSLAELLKAATCGYEDYYVALKSEGGVAERLLEHVDWASVDEAYEEVCLKPWLKIQKARI